MCLFSLSFALSLLVLSFASCLFFSFLCVFILILLFGVYFVIYLSLLYALFFSLVTCVSLPFSSSLLHFCLFLFLPSSFPLYSPLPSLFFLFLLFSSFSSLLPSPLIFLLLFFSSPFFCFVSSLSLVPRGPSSPSCRIGWCCRTHSSTFSVITFVL